MMIKNCLMFNLLQWNAPCLIGNGQQLLKAIKELQVNPEIMGFEDKQLKLGQDFVWLVSNCKRDGREINMGDV